MSTVKKIEANRHNSQNSTGPRTEAGKEKSAQNHLSHGFISTIFRLIPGEDPDQWKALVDGLTAEYQPATPTEQILVGKMCHNQWLSLRALRLQGDAFTQTGGWLSSDKLKISPDLGLLIRYHTSAERAFHKAHADLVKAQKERKISEFGFESKKPSEPASQPAPPAEKTSSPVPPIPEKFEIVPEFTWTTAKMAAATAIVSLSGLPQTGDGKTFQCGRP